MSDTNVISSRKMTSLSEITGSVIRIFFASNTFSTGIIKQANGHGPVRFKCDDLVSEFQPVKMVGRTVVNEYGSQFEAATVEPFQGADPQAVALYLVKRCLPGTDPAIVKRYRGDFVADLLEAPDKIGLSRDEIEILLKGHGKYQAVFEVVPILKEMGVPLVAADQVVSVFGLKARELITENPYILPGKIRGCGFKKVDRYALQAGFAVDDPRRVQCAIAMFLTKDINEGHCWTYTDKVIAALKEMPVEKNLEALIFNAKVVRFGDDKVGMKWLFTIEKELFSIFRKAANPLKIEPTDWNNLNEEQRQAVLLVLKNQLSVVTGAAGTGKTYLITTLINYLVKNGFRVAVAAFTGKAAKRMEELLQCNVDTKTIHRLLEYDGKTFNVNRHNQLEYDAVIVDEASMIDSPIAWRLLTAIDHSKTMVVLAGDHHQLPPVGVGNVFRDLVRGDIVPTTELIEVQRSRGILLASQSDILKGTIALQRVPEWVVLENKPTAAEILATIESMYQGALKEKLGFDVLTEVQLLTPKHDGPIGTKKLNTLIQAIIQKQHFGVEVSPKQKFYVGDRVVQTVNNYDTGIMNGETGRVMTVLDNGNIVVDFSGLTVELLKAEGHLADISLAYALSIHKSQGSEYPCVIVIVHSSHSFMLHRNLFYTAVTRAQQTAIILGDRRSIARAANRVEASKRRTFISEMI